jgi:hypothetical protein
MGVETAILLAAAGGGIKAFGQVQANMQEAQAEKQNAAFYKEQADLSLKISKKDQQIFEKESDQFFGSQVSAFAKAGVDISGSALLKLVDTKLQTSNESAQIVSNGKRQAQSYLFASNQASSRAKRLGSLEHNLLQVAGTGLSTAGNIINMGESN